MNTQQQELPIQKQVESTGAAIDNIISKVEFVGLSGLGGVDAMRRKLEENAQIRRVIDEFIDKEFVKGKDFGPADMRNPKDTLLKPGAEKACHLFDTHPQWVRDDEVWEMLGKPEGVVCLKCLIIDNKTGKIIGEGRGAEKVGNKARDANKTIKAAEKCALIDAVLYTYMLSDRFTQDDGGKGTVNLNDGKKMLQSTITDLRSGCASTMTDVQFIIAVCDKEIHKKSINTVGELEHVRKAIEDGKYDLNTGDRVPDSIR